MRMMMLSVLNLAFDVIYVILLIRVFMSYLPNTRFTRLLRPVLTVTEPALAKIRSGLPPATIGFDASPFIAMVLIYLFQQLLIKLISII